jgi:hypothetical protein
MKSGIATLSVAILLAAGCRDAQRSSAAPDPTPADLRAALMDLTFDMQDNSAIAVNKGNLAECAALIKAHGKPTFIQELKAIALSSDELRSGFAVHLFMEHSERKPYDALVTELKSKFPDVKAWPSYDPQQGVIGKDG